MKPKRRFILPGDNARPLPLDLNRAEVITLHAALLAEIEAYGKKGESIYKLDRLAEKLESILRPGDKPAKP